MSYGLESRREELVSRIRIPEPSPCRLHLERQHIRRLESGGHGEQMLKAAKQESGTGQQHERERELDDNQRAPGDLASVCGSRCPAVYSQFGSRPVQRRHDSNRETDDRHESQREHQHPAIHANGRRAWQLVWAERDHQIDRERSQRDPDKTADDREEHSFGDQLTHESQSRRTQRRTHHQLRPPLDTASQNEIGDIDASDCQQESHRAQNGEQRRSDLAHEIILKPCRDEAIRKSRVRRPSECAIRRARNRVEFVPRLLLSDAGAQPANHVQMMAPLPAVGGQRGVVRQREPDLR